LPILPSIYILARAKEEALDLIPLSKALHPLDFITFAKNYSERNG
jgi:hypothetical protein